MDEESSVLFCKGNYIVKILKLFYIQRILYRTSGIFYIHFYKYIVKGMAYFFKRQN